VREGEGHPSRNEILRRKKNLTALYASGNSLSTKGVQETDGKKKVVRLGREATAGDPLPRPKGQKGKEECLKKRVVGEPNVFGGGNVEM